MDRPALLILAAMLAVLARPLPASNLRRGTYHHDPQHGFAIWIPAGFTRAPPRSDAFIASYRGSTPGGYAIEFLKPKARKLSETVAACLRESRNQFPDGKREVIRDVDAGGRPAVVVVLTELAANEKFRNTELVQACVPLGATSTLAIILYTKPGGHGRGLEEMRWMLGTLRYLGGRGLDAYLGRRRVHVPTGVSYRPPRGFRPETASSASRIFAGLEAGADRHVTIERTNAATLEAALATDTPRGSRETGPYALPHPEGFAALGTFVSSGSRGAARVAVAMKGGEAFTVLVSASGPSRERERLLRTAELVARALRYVDVKAAGEKAQKAIAGLEHALRKRDETAVRDRVKALADLAFLEPVAAALVKALPRIANPEIQVMVAHALAGPELPALADDLLRMAKHVKVRLNPPVLAAVLEALGCSRTRRAVNLLIGHATRGDPRVSAAAIRALGRYVEQRERIAKRLVKLMARAESAANRKSNPLARQRWDALLPAYQEALENLTGERFDTAEDAKFWLKRKQS